jgi:hypothetical protein
VGNEKRRERETFYFRDEESVGFAKASLVPLHLDTGYFALVYILILQAGSNQ